MGADGRPIANVPRVESLTCCLAASDTPSAFLLRSLTVVPRDRYNQVPANKSSLGLRAGSGIRTLVGDYRCFVQLS